MNKFEGVFSKFRKGGVLTNTELTYLYDELTELASTLQGKGDVFAASKELAQNELSKCSYQLLERGVNL